MDRPAKLTDTRSDEPIRVLIVNDEYFHAKTIAEGLERVGYICTIAASGKAGAKHIEDEDYDVILTDLKMAKVDGLEILRKARLEQPETAVVVITGHGDIKT